MKILILEGIATSGKTTIINKLDKLLSEKKVSFSIIDEEQTLMPILKNRDKDANLSFIETLLMKVLKSKKDVLIFDRLYLTHIYRSVSSPKDFMPAAKLLMPYKPTFILLTVKEEKIMERIYKTAKVRECSWLEFVQQKGNDEEEVAEYYIDQQKKFVELINNIEFESVRFDTTDNNFDQISKEIYTNYLHNHN
ncbi:MAG: hypothetical protein Q7S53_05110 [bacterium]|nr:hypothetical protein [bacterium]